MATTSTMRSNSPEITTEQVHAILTEPLRLASTFLASGVRIFDTTGPIRFPIAPQIENSEDKLGGDGAAFWHGESELITEADADFSEVKLMPSTMKSVKAITRYSNELARASVVGLDSVISSAMVTEIAQKLDRQFYANGGDGTTQPKGMFAWAGTQSVAVGGALTLDKILAAQGLALGAGVPVGNLRFYCSPADFITLRSAKDGDQRYMLEPDAQRAAGPTVLGMPVTVAPFIPAGFAAVADPTQIVVARDASPSIKILTERYADYDQQAVRVVCRYDVGVLNAPAVVKLTGITAPTVQTTK